VAWVRKSDKPTVFGILFVRRNVYSVPRVKRTLVIARVAEKLRHNSGAEVTATHNLPNL
jgi:hypothetical protein